MKIVVRVNYFSSSIFRHSYTINLIALFGIEDGSKKGVLKNMFLSCLVVNDLILFFRFYGANKISYVFHKHKKWMTPKKCIQFPAKVFSWGSENQFSENLYKSKRLWDFSNWCCVNALHKTFWMDLVLLACCTLFAYITQKWWFNISFKVHLGTSALHIHKFESLLLDTLSSCGFCCLPFKTVTHKSNSKWQRSCCKTKNMRFSSYHNISNIVTYNKLTCWPC